MGKMFKDSFYVGGLEVDKLAYAEGFDGKFLRFIITADDEETVRYAAEGTTPLPSTVLGRPEGGIERYLSPGETPDGRPGAIVQLWMNVNTPPDEFDYEMSARLRQGTLVELETAIFNADTDWQTGLGKWQTEKYDTMKSVGYCGDGFQKVVKKYKREMISVPIMSGEFLIEKELGVGKGVMGANLWFFCENKDCLPELREKALNAIQKIPGSIAPFRICSAGSKVGSLMAKKYEGTEMGRDYKQIGPTTNHEWCPSLRNEIPNSKVPEGIERIPEIVIDGIKLEVVGTAMKSVVEAVEDVEGIAGISAGNYGGGLGKYKLFLKDLYKDLF